MPEEKGIMYELLNVDADKESEEKLRALVKHLQGQMRDVYVYWVGNWGRGNQACSINANIKLIHLNDKR